MTKSVNHEGGFFGRVLCLREADEVHEEEELVSACEEVAV